MQTIQYQVVTLLTTNGQAPFVTVFMYLGEAKDEREKQDLALIIEEVLEQRYQGVKNEKGVWVTPAFPSWSVSGGRQYPPDAPYYYLTELAAKCTAKRMVPDYISEKIMKQLKVDQNGDGQCYTLYGLPQLFTPYVDEEASLNTMAGSTRAWSPSTWWISAFRPARIWTNSGRSLTSAWSFATALQCRHERLTGTVSDVAPILWQYGALARLKRARRSTNCSTAAIPPSRWAMRACGNALRHDRQKLTEPEGEAFGPKIMRKSSTNIPASGKRLKISTTACMARRWRAPPISSPNACSAASASSRA